MNNSKSSSSSSSHLLSVLQALQGQTITPELLQSLVSTTPPTEDDQSVDDLLIAQQVAEHDKMILAAMNAASLPTGPRPPCVLDPFADMDFSDSEGEEDSQTQHKEQSASLDALLKKHNLHSTVEQSEGNASETEDLVDPEIFTTAPQWLPQGEPEIFAGYIDSLLEKGKLAVISGGPTALDVGTSLALGNAPDRAVIAVVVDTFGSVSAPLLLAVARDSFTEELIGRSLITVASQAQVILLDEANGVFAIRGERNDANNQLEDAGDVSEDDENENESLCQIGAPDSSTHLMLGAQPSRPTFSWTK